MIKLHCQKYNMPTLPNKLGISFSVFPLFLIFWMKIIVWWNLKNHSICMGYDKLDKNYYFWREYIFLNHLPYFSFRKIQINEMQALWWFWKDACSWWRNFENIQSTAFQLLNINVIINYLYINVKWTQHFYYS